MDLEKDGSKQSSRNRSNADNLSIENGFSLQPPPLQLKPSDDENKSQPQSSSIEAAFGSHDVSKVSPSTGVGSVDLTSALGSSGHTSDSKVGFTKEPDLPTVAHEAAHIVGQNGSSQKEDKD